MKALIKHLLRLLGIRVTQTKFLKNLPRPNVDNIEIVVRLYSMMKQRITVLQIGACDGFTSDSIYPYVKAGDMNAYLVEPSKVNFKKLSEFYNSIGNAHLIQAAIADKDEKRMFYTIKDEGRWKDDGWARQLASFYKEHLLKHNILESEIQAEEVDCLTLKSIVKKYNIENLDVLLIDTEGYDGEIVKMALNDGVRPNFIAFENVQLVKNYNQKDLDNLYERLATAGYVWTHDRINTMAIRKDFFATR